MNRSIQAALGKDTEQMSHRQRLGKKEQPSVGVIGTAGAQGTGAGGGRQGRVGSWLLS